MLVRFRQFVESVVVGKNLAASAIVNGKRSLVFARITKDEVKVALRIIAGFKKVEAKKGRLYNSDDYYKRNIYPKELTSVLMKELKKFGDYLDRWLPYRMQQIVYLVWKDTDPERFADQIAKDKAAEKKRLKDLEDIRADRARDKHDREMEEQLKKTLKKAANFARRMGLDVRSSEDLKGRISSYYVKDPAGGGPGVMDYRPVRISDHELPNTDQRQFMRSMHKKPPFKAQIILWLYGDHGKKKIYFSYENVNDFDEFEYSDSLIKKAIKVGVTGEGGDPDEI